jgi:hypothetical protein
MIFTFKGIKKIEEANGNAIKLQWLVEGFKSRKTMKGRETWWGEGGREFQILKSFPRDQEKVGLSIAKWGKEG